MVLSTPYALKNSYFLAKNTCIIKLKWYTLIKLDTGDRRIEWHALWQTIEYKTKDNSNELQFPEWVTTFELYEVHMENSLGYTRKNHATSMHILKSQP